MTAGHWALAAAQVFLLVRLWRKGLLGEYRALAGYCVVHLAVLVIAASVTPDVYFKTWHVTTPLLLGAQVMMAGEWLTKTCEDHPGMGRWSFRFLWCVVGLVALAVLAMVDWTYKRPAHALIHLQQYVGLLLALAIPVAESCFAWAEWPRRRSVVRHGWILALHQIILGVGYFAAFGHTHVNEYLPAILTVVFLGWGFVVREEVQTEPQYAGEVRRESREAILAVAEAAWRN